MSVAEELRTFCAGNPPSETIAAWLAEHAGVVLLSMSTGKDSLAAWSLLRRYGIDVVPVFEAKVPGLSLVEATIAELEDRFETHVYRTVADAFPRWLNGGFLQPLHRLATIAALEIPSFHRDDVTAHVARCRGIEPILVTGVRSADSVSRQIAHRRYGVCRAGKSGITKLDLVHDWRLARVRSTVLDERIPYSDFEYRYYGRTFDALNFQQLAPIRDHAPDDWDVVRFWFPLADIAIDRQLISDRSPHVPTNDIPEFAASIPSLSPTGIPTEIDSAEAVRSIWDLPEIADMEVSSEVELRHIASELQRSDNGRANLGYLHDGGYYAQLVFRSGAEAQAFVKASGCRLAGARDPFALDGAALAARMGVTLPAQPRRYSPSAPPSLPRRYLMPDAVRAERVPLVLPEV